jgi:hypothetical protein
MSSSDLHRYLVDVLGGNLNDDEFAALNAAGVGHRASNPAPFIAEQFELTAASVNEARRRITDVIGFRELGFWVEAERPARADNASQAPQCPPRAP